MARNRDIQKVRKQKEKASCSLGVHSRYVHYMPKPGEGKYGI